MNDAGRRDDLVGRVPPEIEPGRRAGDGQVDRPGVDPAQGAYYLPIIQIQFDTAQLDELCDLPQDDRGNRPLVTGKQSFLIRAQVSLKGVNQDVCVEVQHSASQRIPVDMMSPFTFSLSRKLPIRVTESRL